MGSNTIRTEEDGDTIVHQDVKPQGIEDFLLKSDRDPNEDQQLFDSRLKQFTRGHTANPAAKQR